MVSLSLPIELLVSILNTYLRSKYHSLCDFTLYISYRTCCTIPCEEKILTLKIEKRCVSNTSLFLFALQGHRVRFKTLKHFGKENTCLNKIMP